MCLELVVVVHLVVVQEGQMELVEKAVFSVTLPC